MIPQVVKNIFEDILEISDLRIQKELWLGNNANCTSSFTEVYCRLFDDNNFEDFIQHASENGVHEKLTKELMQLRDMLNGYDEQSMTDEQIINDPMWHSVSEQAEIVVALWKNDEVLYGMWARHARASEG